MSQSAGMPIALSYIEYDTDTQLMHDSAISMHAAAYSTTASLAHLFISV